MDTATTILDPMDPSREIESLAPAPYAGCLSIGVLGHAIVCAMPQFIELDEIARPLSLVPPVEFAWLDAGDGIDAGDEVDPLEFEPPLLAAGHFSTVARRGTLPPLEWDY